MNAPVLYVVIPGVVGALLAVFNQNASRNRIISIILVLFLALLGLALPAGSAVTLGSGTLNITESMSVLGRQFTITSADAPFITWMYAILAFWLLGSIAVSVSRWFYPLSLAITALLVAAISSEVFLFAAPLILAAVILSIPLLAPPESPPGPGVVRYLVFQTLALPCILLAGYILTGFETGPSDSSQALLSAVLLGIGFAFLLGIFPFNTWLPQLLEYSPTYVTAFIMVTLPMTGFWLMVHFIDTYVWIRTNEQVFTILRLTGILMVLVGGVWICFQTSLKRMLAFAIMADIGQLLLALGTGQLAGLQVLSGLYLVRALNIGLASLALAAISKSHPELDLKDIQGIFEKNPIAISAYLAALLSMAGVPFLANFPAKLALTGQLGSINTLDAFLFIAGSIGLVVGCLRVLGAMYTPLQGRKLVMTENLLVIILLSAGIVFNILISIFPDFILSPFHNFLNAFTHLPR